MMRHVTAEVAELLKFTTPCTPVGAKFELQWNYIVNNSGEDYSISLRFCAEFKQPTAEVL